MVHVRKVRCNRHGGENAPTFRFAAADPRPLVDLCTGVQHIFHPPVLLEDWPDEDRGTRLVFIVRDLEQELFDHTLKAFNEGPSYSPRQA